MDKVKTKLPSWGQTKSTSKKGFDKVWGWADKLGDPVNRLTNRIGSEAFWPTTLDKESEKAARILRSFCKDGFYSKEQDIDTQVDETAPATTETAPETASETGASSSSKSRPLTGPRQKQRVLKKIPARVIANAVGLAIFTTMRTGLWISGAGGSGILVARQEDGSWSPPSGIMLHTAGLGFLVGVDIYDCVLVINSREALKAFTSVRVTLGGEISAVAGPVGMGGVLENDKVQWHKDSKKDGDQSQSPSQSPNQGDTVDGGMYSVDDNGIDGPGKKKKNKPFLFTYLKSRGFYAGVQVDGTIVIERSDENARFYGQPGIHAADIFDGKAKNVPWDKLRMLTETLKAAEGRGDVDSVFLDQLADQPAPGDVSIDEPASSAGYGDGALEKGELFGIPSPADPDPYGVLALEKEGLEIRDAVTHSRPASEEFAFNPTPTSPIFHQYRRSMASSHRSLDRPFSRFYVTADKETQTKPVVILSVEDDVEAEVHGKVADSDEDRSVYEDVPEPGDAQLDSPKLGGDLKITGGYPLDETEFAESKELPVINGHTTSAEGLGISTVEQLAEKKESIGKAEADKD